MDRNARKLSNPRGIVQMLRFVIVLGALIATSMAASTQSDAETGRVHITFSNTGRGGSGYLFYQGQKYGLAIITPEIRKIWATSIDLIGTASNMRDAADVIGTYAAADPAAATIRRAKTVRLENKKGVVLEIRSVNLSRWSTLNLSGMTLKNAGWQPSSE
jgi:hypothetical protein